MTDETRRHFTVATFVIDAAGEEPRVLLLFHRKLEMWLPPGGHVDENELPDQAAVREVWEETGVEVELVGEKALPLDKPGCPRQLVVPRGIQLEDIAPGHQHIDLVYFARPVAPGSEVRKNRESDRAGWYTKPEAETLPLTEEMRMWVEKAFGHTTSRGDVHRAQPTATAHPLHG